MGKWLAACLDFLRVHSIYGLIVLASSTLFVELMLRTFFPVREYRADSVSHISQKLGWGPKLNADGSRTCDSNVPINRTTDKVRILLVGDSNLDCDKSAQPRKITVPYLLEKTLGNRYEVINMAGPGWGNDQEYLYYLHLGRQYKPDFVFLFFTPANDLYNNSTNKAIWESRNKPRFELAHGKLRLVRTKNKRIRFLSSFLAQFQIFKRTRLIRQSHLSQRIALPNEKDEQLSHVSAYLNPLPKRIGESWKVTNKLLSNFNRSVREQGGKFVVVYIPTGINTRYLCPNNPQCLGYGESGTQISCNGKIFNLDIYQPFRRLKEITTQTGIPYLHNINEVRNHAHNHTTIVSDCLHLSKYGASLLVNKVAAYLIEN